MDHYSFMVPVMKTLIAKLSDTVFSTDSTLAELNVKNPGFAFYESFQVLNQDDYWMSFIENKVRNFYFII